MKTLQEPSPVLSLPNHRKGSRKNRTGVLLCVWMMVSLCAGQQAGAQQAYDDLTIHDATAIPSQMELGMGGTVRPESANVLPARPLASWEEKSPFIKDSELTLYLRNYYLTRESFDDSEMETWAQGGYLRLVTGKAWDFLSFGGTVYGSYRLYGPEDKDGASLLKPGQENLTVLGELYVKVNYAKQTLKLGRQEYNLPWINKRDIRMIPYTFEGYALGMTKADSTNFQYIVGYVDKIKKWTADEFISMSEAAGETNGVDNGTVMGGATYIFSDELSLEAFNAWTPDLINLFYAEAVSRLKTDMGLDFKLSGQFLHEEADGDNLLGRYDNNTHAFGGKLETSYNKAVVTLALTGNSRDDDMISPYGTYPGYNSIIYNDYNRAGEYGLRAGLSYDFSELGLPGVSAFGNYVWGSGAVDPATGEDILNRDELDITVQYKPPVSWLQGLSIRLRSATVFEEGGNDLQDYRVIINYTL